jgi:hypothetical protein
MSSAEFSEWIAFYELEPFGRQADFQGHAQTAAMIYNVHRGEKDKPIKVEDLMPKEPKPPQTASQMKQFAEMMTIGLGGTIKGGK